MGEACILEGGLELEECFLGGSANDNCVGVLREVRNEAGRFSCRVDGLCELHTVGQVVPQDDVVVNQGSWFHGSPVAPAVVLQYRSVNVRFDQTVVGVVSETKAAIANAT